MSMTFTKLFSSITESTVWCEPDRTRLVWITMLAMADRMGRVWGSVPGIANRARVPVEDARIAIATFLAPDRDSRSPEHEGRRIEAIDGGWRLINYQKYRDLRDAEARREQNREAQERHRDKVSRVSKVADSQPQSAQAEAEAYAESEAKKKKEKKGIVKGNTLPDADWIATLKANPAYTGLDVDRELGKCQAWLQAKHPHKVLSRSRFVNWLNNAERPLTIQPVAPTRTSRNLAALPDSSA